MSNAPGITAPGIPHTETSLSLRSQFSDAISSSSSSGQKADPPEKLSAPTALLDNFRVWYMAYLVGCMTLGAVAMGVLGSGEPFVDRMFLSVSAATQTGLVTCEFPEQPGTTHVVTFCLIVSTSPVLLSLVPVFLRWRYSMNPEYSRSTAFFGMRTSETDERIALETIMLTVGSYWITLNTLGWLGLWFSLRDYPGGGAWPALFLSVSAFHNSGLITLSMGLPLQEQCAPATLSIVMLLILAGNTYFPMMVRCMLQVVRRFTTDPRRRRVLRMLLKHPRTCYTHLFPEYANRWLWMITPALVLVQIFALVLTLLVGGPAHTREPVSVMIAGLTPGETILSILFSSVSTRTAGFSVLDFSLLDPSSTFVFCVCMWIAASPVVVAMRSTAVSLQGGEETFVSEKEWSELKKRERQHEPRIVREQLANFMSEHSVLLVCLMFGILFFEEYYTSAYYVASTDFMKVVFEFCSAYGNVGLSMATHPRSLSGAWSWESRVLLMVVMFLGRCRALPESIDPTFELVSHRRKESDPTKSALTISLEDAGPASDTSDGERDEERLYEGAAEGGVDTGGERSEARPATYGSCS